MAIGTPVFGTLKSQWLVDPGSIEVEKPGTVNEGDILVLCVWLADDGYPSVDESGWTEQAVQASLTLTDVVCGVFTKVATASEPSTYTVSHDGGINLWITASCSAWPGVDNTTPMDATPTQAETTNSSTVDPQDITTTTTGNSLDRVVAVIEAAIDSADPTTNYPSGYTLSVDEFQTDFYAGFCYKTGITAGATESPGTWSGFGAGTVDHATITIALRPASEPSTIVKSVERVTIDWDATSEPVTQNLSKGQDETQCVPFFTKRLVSGSLADDFRERTMKVEMIDNAGTPAVRISATGKSDTDDHRAEVYVVEFESSITVQQVDGDIADTVGSANITISDVGAQTKAFFLYSYQYTHGSAQDRPDYACVRPIWNGASTTSVTVERTGTTGAIDGMLYVVSCDNSEFSVQHRDISVAATDELTNDTITGVQMASTFLLTHFRSSEAEDDPLDWSFVADLSTTTNVRVRRSIAGASNAAANVGVQVVTALGGEWSVQRGDFTTTSNLTEQTVISAVDPLRAFVKTGTHEAGLNSLGTSDLAAGTIVDEVGPSAYLSANNVITWVRESVSETGNTIPWEVIQFSAGLDNPILIPTGPLR